LKMVVGIVGMPGSGKTTMSSCAKEKGWTIVVMGDVVREETSRRGLEPTPSNVGKTMLDLRREEGPGVIAKRCIENILESASECVIVEGIRSLDELTLFRQSLPNFTLIAIHASPDTRFKRLFNRGRSDDPKNWKLFSERDRRELEVGIGSAIAMADHVISNEVSLSEFRAEVKNLLKKMSRSP
jgi:dephospho-CoA kinase